MKKVLSTLALLVAVWIPVATFAQTPDIVNTNEEQPLSYEEFVWCANGGQGEIVKIEGTLHFTSHITFVEGEKFTGTFRWTNKGVSGTGLTTGDTYRVVGMDGHTQNIRSDWTPHTFTGRSMYRVIGPGTGNDVIFQLLVHWTVNTSGVVTVG